MDLHEAIIHARQVAEGCGVDSRDCAYQHDRLADWLEELQAYRTKIHSDRLDEAAKLVNVWDEGRVAVLPCKRGDKVWRICGPKGRKFVAERTVLSITVYEPGQFEIFTNCLDWLGKTVFLTRAEAEAVLSGEGKRD